MLVCVGVGVWMEVGRPCPPVRDDIVIPRNFFCIFCIQNIVSYISAKNGIAVLDFPACVIGDPPGKSTVVCC